MNRTVRISLLLLLLSPYCYADKIPAPPPLPAEPVEEQDYLYKIYKNIGNFEITTSAPDSVRKGHKGDAILYDNSGVFTLWVNVDDNTDWTQI